MSKIVLTYSVMVTGRYNGKPFTMSISPTKHQFRFTRKIGKGKRSVTVGMDSALDLLFDDKEWEK